VTLNYAGVRRTTRTVKIGTARNAQTGAIAEQSAGTTELYDRQGRLWRVTEPSGEGGADVTNGELKLEVDLGYIISIPAVSAGYKDPDEARSEGWVIPADEKAARELKEQLRESTRLKNQAK
jgi:hypothetical protein